jgi:hypothetical protein
MSGHARILPTEPMLFARDSRRVSRCISGAWTDHDARNVVATHRAGRTISRATVAERTKRTPSTQEVRNALASAALYSTFHMSTAA